MSSFEGLGKALRWLRARRDRRQYQIAEAAGVTKAMLSAYETGKQNPSLETLEKILEGLGATLGDLYHALLIVQGEKDAFDLPRLGAGSPRGASSIAEGDSDELDADLYHILGVREPLPVEEEKALRQMLTGFHGLMRYMHRGLARARGRPRETFPPPDR